MNEPAPLFADNQVSVFPTHVQTSQGTWTTASIGGVRVVASQPVSVVFPLLLVVLSVPCFLVGSIIVLLGLVLALAGGIILVKRLIEMAIASQPSVWINVGGREFMVAKYASAAAAQPLVSAIGGAIAQRG
jgi:hypothetical protein